MFVQVKVSKATPEQMAILDKQFGEEQKAKEKPQFSRLGTWCPTLLCATVSVLVCYKYTFHGKKCNTYACYS